MSPAGALEGRREMPDCVLLINLGGGGVGRGVAAAAACGGGVCSGQHHRYTPLLGSPKMLHLEAATALSGHR